VILYQTEVRSDKRKGVRSAATAAAASAFEKQLKQNIFPDACYMILMNGFIFWLLTHS
jgi:hypothetical protein